MVKECLKGAGTNGNSGMFIFGKQNGSGKL
jgi:hypothetical protein